MTERDGSIVPGIIDLRMIYNPLIIIDEGRGTSIMTPDLWIGMCRNHPYIMDREQEAHL